MHTLNLALFLQVKDEAWWLILGNTSTSDLYALKRVSFSDRLVTHMELPSTQASLQVKFNSLFLFQSAIPLIFPLLVSSCLNVLFRVKGYYWSGWQPVRFGMGKPSQKPNPNKILNCPKASASQQYFRGADRESKMTQTSIWKSLLFLDNQNDFILLKRSITECFEVWKERRG